MKKFSKYIARQTLDVLVKLVLRRLILYLVGIAPLLATFVPSQHKEVWSLSFALFLAGILGFYLAYYFKFRNTFEAIGPTILIDYKKWNRNHDN
jgi:VIT1/CCC1 family predicted Fe2+/Mn2+ transporter